MGSEPGSDTPLESAAAAQDDEDEDWAPSTQMPGVSGEPELSPVVDDGLAEPMDISALKDDSIIRCMVEAPPVPGAPGGKAPGPPTDGARVELIFAWRPLPGHELDWPDPGSPWRPKDGAPRQISFVLGNCEHCDALEYAVATLKMHETCVVRCGYKGCGDPRAWTDEALGLLPCKPSNAPFDYGASYAPADLLVTLLAFEKVGHESMMDLINKEPEYRVRYALGRKDAAAKYFKAQRFHLALVKYQTVAGILGKDDDIKDENLRTEATAGRRAAQQNVAMCHLKLGDTTAAIQSCTELLQEDPQNEKALYRRAMAHMADGHYPAAEADLKCCVTANPGNQEARRLLQQCKVEAKQRAASEKGMYAKMLEGAGGAGGGQSRESPEADKATKSEAYREYERLLEQRKRAESNETEQQAS